MVLPSVVPHMRMLDGHCVNSDLTTKPLPEGSGQLTAVLSISIYELIHFLFDIVSK